MSGQLDQISEAIGYLRRAVESLARDIAENRALADTRHHENTGRLTTIEKTLEGLVSDRRIAIIGISAITGVIMWAITTFGPALLAKLGWK